MPSLKEALFDLGQTECIALSDFAFDTDPSTPSVIHGTLDKTKPAPACFQWEAHTKGPLVGPEGVSHEAVKTAINKGAFVGRLLQALGADYVVTDEDLEVAMYVKSKTPGEKPTVWNMDLRPLAVVPEPAPATPPPKPDPKPTPPPKPDPAPRLAKLEALLSEVKRITANAAAVQLPAGDHGGLPARGLRQAVADLQAAIEATK